MAEKIIILLLLIMLVQLIIQICSSHAWKKERMELTKMLAARNYTEYKAMDEKHTKPPPTNHNNMVKSQQKKMTSRERR